MHIDIGQSDIFTLHLPTRTRTQDMYSKSLPPLKKTPGYATGIDESLLCRSWEQWN